MRARALASAVTSRVLRVPFDRLGCAHAGAKFNSFGRALPLILTLTNLHPSPTNLVGRTGETWGRCLPRQTPRASQVELPVTMRQPLETDGLQTACHVYCCCHKRQESNNTVPQEARGKRTGAPQTAAWGGWAAAAGGGWWLYPAAFPHLELTPTSKAKPPEYLHTAWPDGTHLTREKTPRKRPPPTCPDMLHLLQLNKHKSHLNI